jgi:hypothetical protein
MSIVARLTLDTHKAILILNHLIQHDLAFCYLADGTLVSREDCDYVIGAK